MKVYIAYETTDDPWGGGNQFIKLLKKYFQEEGHYAYDPNDADIILFNSHQMIDQVAKLKKQFPLKKFVHRIDGPIRLYNVDTDPRDSQVYFANETFADATVFQSEWSKKQNEKLGLEVIKPHKVIPNCSDIEIFFSEIDKKENKKIKLFSSAWSDFIKKGYDVYEWLDKNLDFNRYEYYFAGRPPVKFKNIINLGALRSSELANEMRKCDIFITASQKDPCSNSLIEGLSCGLPALALNDGGHPEIVKSAGLLFSGTNDILQKLTKISTDITNFRSKIKVKRIYETGAEYYSFFESLKS